MSAANEDRNLAKMKREIFVFVDSEQRCYVGHTVNAKSRVKQLRREQRKWIGCAVVEAIDGTFSEAAACARKWRVIAAMNGYETIGNPRILQYGASENWFKSAEEQAIYWPFKVRTLFPKRKEKFNSAEERSRKRDRYIYVVVDKFMRCYVGQSVNPKTRVAQHLGGRGIEATAEWIKEVQGDAEYRIVDSVQGNYWDAQRLEYKWALIAYLNGYENVNMNGRPWIPDEIEKEAHENKHLWPFSRWTQFVPNEQ